MRNIALLCGIAASALAVAVADGAATGPATLVVDRDGVECSNADFTSIQAAVDRAQPGDLIRVCPDLYAESVTVNKPLTLRGEPDAVEAVNCFQPTLPQLPAEQQAVVDPAGDGFSVAFKLQANEIVLEGFVVQGASVGIDASDTFSGHGVHHNLIRLNTLFAIDFGSEGTRESRVNHNCIRENRFGLVSELDDDSLWKQSDGPERDEWNARNLSNARIDHNSTFRNGAGLEAAGPGRRVQVTFDHNVARQDLAGILLQNSEDSRIVDNELSPLPTPAGFRNGIRVGGANSGLEITHNIVTSGQQGIAFAQVSFIDVFAAPTVGATIVENTVFGQTQDGFVAAGPPNAESPAVMNSQFLGNVTTDNLRDGIVLRGSNADNTLRGNIAERNGRYGIFVQGAVKNRFEANTASRNGVDGISLQRAVRLGVNYDARENEFRSNVADGNGRYGIFADQFTTLNVFEGNWMFGNAIFDARDDAPLLSNTWIGNHCASDEPDGLCES